MPRTSRKPFDDRPDFMEAMPAEFRALMAARSDDRKTDPNTDDEPDDALLAAALIGGDE